MVAYVFPGQGSQIRGMGNSLFDEFPDLTAQADKLLGYSIKNLCLEDSSQLLQQTQYTQPALYVVNALSYLKKIQTSNIKPRAVAGHSLGEYSALFAANVFDFATGLTLVKKRGELMNQATGGGMAAVIGLKAEIILEVLRQNHLSNITIANYNSYTQIVISGLKAEIEQSQLYLEQAGAQLFIPLKVSGAFHSSYMKEAQFQFEGFLSSLAFQAPSIPVIANVTAQPYEVADIKQFLAHQITSAVKWTDTIDYLIKQGETQFEEIGPGQVLTGLIRRIQNGM